MMNSSPDSCRAAGLHLLVSHLMSSQLIDKPLTVSPPTLLLGEEGSAGSKSPLPSSAARLCFKDEETWVPAPLEPSQPESGLAPVYVHAGFCYVLPTIRLFDQNHADPGPTFRTLSRWLFDAFTTWRFPREGKEESETTVQKELLSRKTPEPKSLLRIISTLLRYALLGSTHSALRVGNVRLRKPGRPPWLRKIRTHSELAQAVDRRLVITACSNEKKGVPFPVRPGQPQYCIAPSSGADWGLDPVHTPENKEQIRLVGRLGAQTAINESTNALECSATQIPLSLSTAQIPFAGFDEPRRLLLGAKAQAQAIAVKGSQTPTVTSLGTEDTPLSPPGVNLRTGYLAWKGWNHEDAWVISESAAKRLCAWDVRIRTVLIPALESDPDLKIKEGDIVDRWTCLLRRRLSPMLLSPTIEGVAELYRDDQELGDVSLPSARDVQARFDGRIEKIECWNLHTKDGIPQQWGIPPDQWHVPIPVRRQYRKVIRFHVRKELPLQVGDKLANRHGHKGIVGKIVKDCEMPRWNGRALEALIDPISVLNRSNWGQIHETLFGGLLTERSGEESCPLPLSREALLQSLHQLRERGLQVDDAGRSLIQGPKSSDGWCSEEVWGIAGVQFVMRLPKHATREMSADLQGKSRRDHRRSTRRSRSRLSQQGSWAQWSHGLIPKPVSSPQLSEGGQALADLLETAGFQLSINASAGTLELKEMSPEELPSSDEQRCLDVTTITKQNWEDRLQEWKHWLEDREDTERAWLKLSERSGTSSPCRWLRIPPAGTCPAGSGEDGRVHLHPLTRKLSNVLTRAVHVQLGYNPRSKKLQPDLLQEKLGSEIEVLRKMALERALGNEWTSYKNAVLGEMVLRPRLPQSGRAVLAPAGLDRDQLGWEMHIADLDQVLLPIPIARAVLGKDIPASATDQEVRERFQESGIWVWVKRDPVLHRWGLLGLQAKVHEDPANDTIGISASLLDALGADYDGDCLTVLGRIPGIDAGQVSKQAPSQICWDEVLNRPLFVPRKQYLYGLFRLQKSSERLSALQRELENHHAPQWPEKAETGNEAVAVWSSEVMDRPDATGSWWGILERSALQALGESPGMDLGLVPTDQLGNLEVCRCNAAKRELYQSDPTRQSEAIAAYEGRSLDVFRQHGSQTAENQREDIIEAIMVKAATVTQSFGAVLRRLIYHDSSKIDEGFLRAAQAITEQLVQRVLSVKAGSYPLDYSEFKRHVLKPLLENSQVDFLEGSRELTDLLELKQLQAAIQFVASALSSTQGEEAQSWLQWMRSPRTLEKRLRKVASGTIGIPLDDVRASPFLCPPGGEPADSEEFALPMK